MFDKVSISKSFCNIFIYTFYYNSNVTIHIHSPNQIQEWAHNQNSK